MGHALLARDHPASHRRPQGPRGTMDRMPTCVYCGSSGPFGKEHYIPRALGTCRGLVPLADKICEKPCGDDLSKLDQAIVRNSPDAFFRVLAGVRGRAAHDEVSPLYYGLFSRQTIKVVGKHP